MMNKFIFVFIFFMFSASSFAVETIKELINKKIDSAGALIYSDTSLAEEEIAKMQISAIFGNTKTTSSETENSSKLNGTNTSKIVGSVEIENSEGFDTGLIENNILSTIVNTTMESIMESITLGDKEFGLLNRKINVIDTVTKKFTCSGGNIAGGKSQNVDSNLIFIYWAFGLPRKGIYTSCKGGATVEVDYFDRTTVPANGFSAMIPHISDSVFRITYDEKTTLLVIDVLTGDLVLEKNIDAASRTEGTFFGSSDALGISTNMSKIHRDSKKIDIKNISAGLYFFAILDSVGDVIYIKTYNKEM